MTRFEQFIILIVGSGGREHMIAKKLNTSRVKLYYVSKYKNPFMSKLAIWIHIGDIKHTHIIASIAKSVHTDLVVIGPELPLHYGVVNECAKYDIPCIGPTKELAKIESSKAFARILCKKYIPYSHKYIPDFHVFNVGDDYTECIKALIKENKYFVIKADGLHGGKGVKVFGEHINSYDESVRYCKDIHDNNEAIVIEERLYGKEFSLMSFCDGNSLSHTIPVQDFKRAFEQDKGPNTGSMGSITDYNNTLNFLTDDDINTARYLNEVVIDALYKELNESYKGIIYGSFMKTNNGIKIIEFNCRFGDPECINVLTLLETDLLDIFISIISSRLADIDIKFSKKASVFKYIVPNGYPETPVRDQIINFPINDSLIVASVRKGITGDINNTDLNYYNIGSRTLGYINVSKFVIRSAVILNRMLDKVSGPLYYRKDIGLVYDKITYDNCGVNIEEGNNVVKDIEKDVTSTYNSHVINKFGDFGGAFQLSPLNYKIPVLVSTTDGVGTKTIFIIENFPPEKAFNMLGTDIVNHCINDILVKGAKPLFFLDYIASSVLKKENISYFVKGISEACKKAKCVLIGGETAEMPDVYKKGHCDIVGTMIGIVDKDNMINGKTYITSNDILIGLPSSGPHTNGYSLIRKIVSRYESIYGELDRNMIDMLSEPHKSYLEEYNIITDNDINIKGMCHITGGGFCDNIRRIIPDNLKVRWDTFEFTDVFKFIQKISNMDDMEMMSVFNCGIGMIIVIDKRDLVRFNKLNIDYKVVGIIE